MTKMTKINKNHIFQIYSFWLKDAAVFDELGFYEKADCAYWMAASHAHNLGFDVPAHISNRAKEHQKKIDAEKAAA